MTRNGEVIGVGGVLNCEFEGCGTIQVELLVCKLGCHSGGDCNGGNQGGGGGGWLKEQKISHFRVTHSALSQIAGSRAPNRVQGGGGGCWGVQGGPEKPRKVQGGTETCEERRAKGVGHKKKGGEGQIIEF